MWIRLISFVIWVYIKIDFLLIQHLFHLSEIYCYFFSWSIFSWLLFWIDLIHVRCKWLIRLAVVFIYLASLFNLRLFILALGIFVELIFIFGFLWIYYRLFTPYIFTLKCEIFTWLNTIRCFIFIFLSFLCFRFGIGILIFYRLHSFPSFPLIKYNFKLFFLASTIYRFLNCLFHLIYFF